VFDGFDASGDLRAAAEQFGDAPQQVDAVPHGARLEHVHRHAGGSQLVDVDAAVLLGHRQHQVRLQVNDGRHVRVLGAADGRFAGHPGGRLRAVIGQRHDLLAAPEVEQNLGDTGHQ
jgi:hypothetical protein